MPIDDDPEFARQISIKLMMQRRLDHLVTPLTDLALGPEDLNNTHINMPRDGNLNIESNSPEVVSLQHRQG